MLSPGETTPQKRGFRSGSPLSGIRTSPDLRPRGESLLSDASLGAGSISTSYQGGEQLVDTSINLTTSQLNSQSTAPLREIDCDVQGLPDVFPLFRVPSHPTHVLTKWLETVLCVNSKIFDNVFAQAHHLALESKQPKSKPKVAKWWSGKNQSETRAVILVLCLNAGTDPPGKVQVDPRPELLCWCDPSSFGSGQRVAQEITMLLRAQYLRNISDGLHFMKLPDAPYEDLPAMKEVRSRHNDRVIFHYNGLGVPTPADKGELWVFNKKYTEYIPVRPPELLSWVGLPAVFILDVRSAGTVLEGLKQAIELNGLNVNDLIALCASRDELPLNPSFPADVFTSALTSPVQLAIRYHCYTAMRDDHNAIMCAILRTPVLRDNISTMYETIADSIAYESMPSEIYFRLFRDDKVLASLFRNFLFASRVMGFLNVHPISYPELPETRFHGLWDTWDFFIDTTISKIATSGVTRELPASAGEIYRNMLDSFMLWVSTATPGSESPPNLRFVLNALFAPALGERALYAIALYIDTGREAANTLLQAGLSRRLIHLTNGHVHSNIKPVLLYVWMKLAVLDDELLLVELNPSTRFFVSILEGTDTAISSPEGNLFGWANSTGIKLMCVTILTFLCKHSIDTRCAVGSRLFSKFEGLLSPLYSAQPDTNGHQGRASLLVSLLVLLTLMANADIPFQMDLLNAGAHQWVTECMSSKVPCVRAAAIAFIGSLLPRSTDLEDSRSLTSIDTHFMKILLDSAYDLSIWVRLATARVISVFISTLQSPSVNTIMSSSSSDSSTDEHVLLPLATNVVHTLQADSIAAVVTLADAAAAQLNVAPTNTHRPSNTPPSLSRGLSGLSGGLGSADNKKAFFLCKSDLSSMTDDLMENGNLSGCLSMGTSPAVEPLEEEPTVPDSEIFVASVSHAHESGLECSKLNDISFSNRCSKMFQSAQVERVTVRCLDECAKVASHQAAKGSIVAEFDTGGSCAVTLHPTARIAIASSKNVAQIWDWEEMNLLNTVNYNTSGKFRDTISHTTVMSRYPGAPLLTSTSCGVVFVSTNWVSPSRHSFVASFHFIASSTFDCISRASSLAPEIWGSGDLGIVKVADLLTEQSFTDIKLPKEARVSSICPPNEYSSPAVAWCGLLSGNVLGVDKREGSETLMLGGHEKECAVTAVCHGNHFSGDDHTVSSLSANGTFKVWDTRKEGNCLHTTELCKKGKLKCTDIHPVAPLVITGSSTSLRVHNPLCSRMSSLSTDRDSGSSLFRSKLSPVISAEFHPLLPVTVSSHSDGKVLISAF